MKDTSKTVKKRLNGLLRKFSTKIQKEYFKITKYEKLYDKSSGVFKINISYETAVEETPRVMKVAEVFGLGLDRYHKFTIYDNLKLKIKPNDIVYITGDSGGGKSVLLKTLEKDLKDEAVNIDNIEVEPDKPIIETVGETFDKALNLLSRVGLNDAFLFLRRYRELSDGQKYRYKLAKLIESGKQWWVMDEFCSTLDRDTAKIVAFNIQKLARRMGRAVIVGTAHTDLFEDLKPSVHIHKRFGGEIKTSYYPDRLNIECSLVKEMKIEEGKIADYKQLAEFHYRNPKTHPPPLKIFKLMRKDEIAGVIYYSPAPPNIYGRTQYFGRRLSIKEINEKLANISRVIIHPKYRSIGLGVKLVRETLPLVGKPFIEVTAVMALYNPFFEKAGMEKIAIREPDESIKQAIINLEKVGFKRYLLTSIETNKMKLNSISKEKRKEIKDILLSVKHAHYRRLQGRGKIYPKRDEFKVWLDKADNETLAKVLSRLAILSQNKVYLIWKKEVD